jgi:hypothetical protein
MPIDDEIRTILGGPVPRRTASSRSVRKTLLLGKRDRREHPDGLARNWPYEESFLGFQAIVHRVNPLAHLIEQAGGLQGRSTGFHGKFIPVQNCRI